MSGEEAEVVHCQTCGEDVEPEFEPGPFGTNGSNWCPECGVRLHV